MNAAIKNGTQITYKNPRPDWHYRHNLNETQQEARRNWLPEVTSTIIRRRKDFYTCADGYQFSAKEIGSNVVVK
jgi:hypothetical protein